MANASIEELQNRVAMLESQMAELLARLKPPPTKDWRSSIGIVKDHPFMREVLEEAQRLRDADREAAKTDPHYFDDQPS